MVGKKSFKMTNHLFSDLLRFAEFFSQLNSSIKIHLNIHDGFVQYFFYLVIWKIIKSKEYLT